MPSNEASTSAGPIGDGAGVSVEASPAEIEQKQSHQQGADRHERQIRPVLAGARRGDRAARNSDREGEKCQRVDGGCAIERARNEVLQERQHHRADEPEPGRDERALPDALVEAQIVQQRRRRRHDVRIDGEIGHGRRSGRNQAGG